MSQTIKRTRAEKTAIGETLLFMAMLGVFLRTENGERLERVALADYLAADPRRVAAWWNRAFIDEKFYMLQQAEMPPGFDNRACERWREMTPHAQDQLGRRVQQLCIKHINALRGYEAEAIAGGVA
ncbi:MAG: hypothetical protein LC725_08080 [Lentisphaerae bacterium]|nr:hypothetical protein [Lentisphaerota bacterium]